MLTSQARAAKLSRRESQPAQNQIQKDSQAFKYWWDLCAGLHVNFTGEINPDAFALESVAGAY